MELIRITSREDVRKLVEENIDSFREEGIHNDVEFTQRLVTIEPEESILDQRPKAKMTTNSKFGKRKPELGQTREMES